MNKEFLTALHNVSQKLNQLAEAVTELDRIAGSIQTCSVINGMATELQFLFA